MDIYEYFNSPDVAAHCQKLGHRFTCQEAAYMVWQSDHHTLQEKIHAWERIPDAFPEDPQLRRFLQEYIHRLQQFLGEFRTGGSRWAYSYERLFADSPHRYQDESPLYDDYALCLAAAKAEPLDGILSFRIRKREIHSETAPRMGDAMVYMNPEGEAVSVAVCPYYGEEDLLVEPFGFYDWYVDLPVPFKRGDVVTGVDLLGQRTGPMILEGLPRDRGEGYLDMYARLWEYDQQKHLRLNEDTCYLSLAYYREQGETV